MAVNNIVFVATDGRLDELARKSILMSSIVYALEKPKIFLVSLDTSVPETDPIFNMVNSEICTLIRVTIEKKDLIKEFPNVMTKKFLHPSGEMLSHWENAEANNQHLAEFSDLAIFYLMKTEPEIDFLYLDSDMIPLAPLFCEKSFVAGYDEGENGSLYINSFMLYSPKGFTDEKERWIASLENEILEKYHFRYGMPGPVAFDKFLNKPENLRGFKLDTLTKDDLSPITFKEMYEATTRAIKKGKPIVVDIDQKGPLLNIPRSAITTALTHNESSGIELVLGITTPSMGGMVMSINFEPKRITGIEYYDRLKDKMES